MAHTTQLPLWRQIRWNLILYSILLAALPIAAVTGITLPRRSDQDQTQVQNQLEAIAELKAAQIQDWLEQSTYGLDVILADTTRQAEFITLLKNSGDPTAINTLLADLLAADPAYRDFTIYDTNGEVLAASNTSDIGKNVRRKPYFNTSLNVDGHIQPPYFEAGGRDLTMFITRRILDKGQTVGVLAASVNLDTMGRIMAQTQAGFPDTGETYLVSSQTNYLLTPSRFEGYSQNRAYRTQGIDRALSQENDSGLYENYRGVEVVGAYRWLPDLQAALLAEVDQEEAFAASRQAQNTSLIIAAVAALAATIVGFYYASYVARPITNLTQAALAISSGDYNQRVKIARQNEIGQLTAAFNTMTDELDKKIKELRLLNEELETRVANRTRDLQVASEVSRQITQVLEPTKLLPELVELTRKNFDLYHVSVFLYEEEDTLLRLQAGTGEAGKLMLADGKQFQLDQQGLVPLAARSRESVVINDVQETENHLPNPFLPLTRAEAALPMVVGSELIGVLDLQAKEAQRFSSQDIALFTTLAEQIAISVRNADSFTEVAQAREAAEKANSVKSQFLASVSHELRTPLNAIINFSKFVVKGTMGPVTERQIEALTKVINSGKHLLNLINDVLDISKIEAGALELFIEENINLSAELKTAIATTETMLAEKPVELIVDIDDNLPLIIGDRQRILQVVLNILSNACKFTDQGYVKLSAHQENGEILIAVEDTGPGIAPEEQEAVFESFKQTSAGLKQGSGTGLGVAISKRLTEAHGGRLWLESTLGEGSTFYVALPVTSTELTPTL